MLKPDKNSINELLTRSVSMIYPSRELLEKRLLDSKPLRVYVGIDPTADFVHIGHSTNYLLLERLHKLGHKIIVLVGDFTAMIGDPSDKTSLRVKLSREEVLKNLETFKEQIAKILPFEDEENPIEFMFNSTWLSKLNFEDVVELAANFTVQQMIERDAFQKRLKDNKSLYVHEFFYPLMQGYDSVAMDVELEIGGTDQTFNMLAGRTLMKRLKDKEKFVITTTLLENPVTGEKMMSKSQGTGVSLRADADEMFGKVMALPDEGIIQCFVDCTRLGQVDIEILSQSLIQGENPKNVKMSLAREIVTMYHSQKAASKAQDNWTKQFSEKQLPHDMDIVEQDLRTPMMLSERLVLAGLATSRSEARRLISQNGVKINSQTIAVDKAASLQENDVLQVGKRHFIKLVQPPK